MDATDCSGIDCVKNVLNLGSDVLIRVEIRSHDTEVWGHPDATGGLSFEEDDLPRFLGNNVGLVEENIGLGKGRSVAKQPADMPLGSNVECLAVR